jgi:molybdate transport system regulatory protein
MTNPLPLKIKIQIYCGDEIAMGPGKADLLDAIVREGSISGAGRSMGMSYRRTWMLVDTMNRCWDQPLVETLAGGSRGGGAKVTKFGRNVLAHYREVQRLSRSLVESGSWSALQSAMRAQPKPSQKDEG